MKKILLNYKNWNTPFGSIPFNEIELKEIIPAVKHGIGIVKAEVEAVKNNPEEPNFENTIHALEIGDRTLERAFTVVHILSNVKSSDKVQDIKLEVSNLLTDLSQSINMDRDLFKRVKSIYDKRESLNLSPEESEVLRRRYDAFVRSGVHLEGEAKENFVKNQKELVSLKSAFSKNLLKESKEYFLHVLDANDLAGLPEDMIKDCKKAAEARKKEGYGFVFDARTIRLKVLPFLKSRELREELYKAIEFQCFSGGASDNSENARNIINLSLEKANILGYETHADFSLENKMAKTPENVNAFLDKLCDTYIPAYKREFKSVEAFAKSIEGEDFEMMPWDFFFYQERLKESVCNLDENELKEYFTYEKVRETVFSLVNKLYGLEFVKNTEIQVWNPFVEVYEVYQGSCDKKCFLGLIYQDVVKRPGVKRGGAWMCDFIEQENNEELSQRPHIQLCLNLTGEAGSPDLLMTVDDVRTYLHEFGHVLHGLLSMVKYSSVSGTNVYRDFVELPSQVMESFFYEKELFLDKCAFHYKTGEPLPDRLYKSLLKARTFGAGFDGARQLSFGVLDMAAYTLKEKLTGDLQSFEKEVLAKFDMYPNLELRGLMLSHFSHIMSGGYAAGYYSYKWGEVLDANAFEAMRDSGFSDEKVTSFRENILEKGGSEDPEILYRRFNNGEMPDEKALFKREGLL